MMTQQRTGNVIPISTRNGCIGEIPQFERRTAPEPKKHTGFLTIFIVGCLFGACLGGYIGWFILGRL